MNITGMETLLQFKLLARLKQDCEYYLGFGNRHKKHLWALDEKKQIRIMKALYEGLPEKPEWLPLKKIDEYEKEMLKIE